MKPSFVAAAAALLIGSTGCAARIVPIPPITAVYRFADIERAEDQQLIARTIQKYGKNVQPVSGEAANPVYTFTLERIAVVEQLHADLAFVGSEKKAGQRLNVIDPRFSINYSTTNISGSVQVIVTFNVTPGSVLEVRGDNGSYQPREVDSRGRAQFTTQIKRDQEFIYARTRSAAVCKEIRLKIETGKQEDVGLCK